MCVSCMRGWAPTRVDTLANRRLAPVLQIDAPQRALTKGEAAELISRHFWRLATPVQQEQLQVGV